MSLKRKITIEWSVEDILDRAKENNINITEKQALKILADIEHHHDASIGINWDVIDSYLEMLEN